jgi:hypothetical protein
MRIATKLLHQVQTDVFHHFAFAYLTTDIM